MRNVLFLGLFLLTISCIAQTNEEVKKTPRERSLYYGLTYTPILGKSFIGISNDWKWNVYKRLSLGVSASMFANKLDTSFQYKLDKPNLILVEYNFLSQWNVVKKNNFRFNAGLNTGFAQVSLTDRSGTSSWVFMGNSGASRYPKWIATNVYYNVTPTMEVAYRLKDIFWLTGQGKYRFLYGNSLFSNAGQLSNYIMSVGIMIID